MRTVVVAVLMAMPVGCSTSPGNPPPPAGTPPAPLLRKLEVSGMGITLTPQFSPSIHDYYVACSAATNTLEVSVTAEDGALGALLQPKQTTPRASQSLSLEVHENQAIVATATVGTATTEYWVRCLPHDVPAMRMEKHAGVGTPTPGYYLIGTQATNGYAMVLDSNGVPVWYQVDPIPPPNAMCNVDSLTPGKVSFHPGRGDHPFEVVELASNTISYVAAPAPGPDNHELRYLANGHYLMLRRPITTGIDLTGVQIPLFKGPVVALGPDSSIQDCEILEVDAGGAIVWRWLGSEHFDPKTACTYPQSGQDGVKAADGSVLLDAFHCNSIDVDPNNGNLLVSSRHMDSVFYIDKASRKVVWKMGGADSSKDGARYVSVADPFYRQHDARIQSWSAGCGKGQVSMFDDQSEHAGPMRGVIFDVNVGAGDGSGCGDTVANGATAGTAKVVWQYDGAGVSLAEGSFRVLADGSRIIGWGEPSKSPGLAFTEVDEAGNDLFDFYLRIGVTTFRAVKVPLTMFDLDVLRATAGTYPVTRR